jgi:hypothetical protein
MHTHLPNKPIKFKQTLPTCQKADGNCLLGWESSADGGIHATRNHSNVTSVLRNTNKFCMTIHNKRSETLISGVLLVMLHNNARPHTASRSRALLEHFNWVLFDHPSYNPDLSANDNHIFT